ncbi:EscU/YscU/HrcU family type III secretion system export apparatus switch protein [Martelella alba]|uniref:EscU/YscU/HrcU family type III secretion system export apparatus switch protein n=1 Tax=Martelella alba TaxID=2590451 RepID=A0ABY2SLB7_9HYPH|nr:EscU/YscU/HrcU family type III secretion system export apparatus switch protein [Martelella alba]TKI05077.1 EscU/YscU/HrcU family type III secretion system export apparatus switch protein [Martelella alba]
MANKTEKPTPKRLRDASQKGQTFKCRDVIIACMLLCGILWLITMGSLSELMTLYRNLIANHFEVEIKAFGNAIVLLALKLIIPILLICILTSALPTLLQTGFLLATKALKLNFNALNPTKGIKKLFSIRTIKDMIKSFLYLGCFAAAIIITWRNNKVLLFSQIHGDAAGIVQIWRELLLSLVLTCLACLILVAVLDAIADYFLHIKELKMDKQEVKREMKELDGNPEIKWRRRQLHMEILSEQTKSDIRSSQFIIANPTHIAIGIYFSPEVVPAPFISVLETNQRALAVRKYAEEVGVPVVRDIALARKIYKSHRLYSFIRLEELDEVLRLLTWLKEVENAWRHEENPSSDQTEERP